MQIVQTTKHCQSARDESVTTCSYFGPQDDPSGLQEAASLAIIASSVGGPRRRASAYFSPRTSDNITLFILAITLFILASHGCKQPSAPQSRGNRPSCAVCPRCRPDSLCLASAAEANLRRSWRVDRVDAAVILLHRWLNLCVLLLHRMLLNQIATILLSCCKLRCGGGGVGMALRGAKVGRRRTSGRVRHKRLHVSSPETITP